MYKNILNLLPYKSSFRFVDHISSLDSEGVVGEYTLKEDAFFYEDHFAGNPGRANDRGRVMNESFVCNLRKVVAEPCPGERGSAIHPRER